VKTAEEGTVGISEEEVMSVGSTREPVLPPRSPKEDWLVQLARLQALLTACPSDLLSRCELAALLETMDLYEEAWVHWKAVIDLDANHLNAREGLVRCHQKTGRHRTIHTVRRSV
jgi:hypothetical protein